MVVRLLTSVERRSASVHILDDLSSSTPEYLWLTDFTELKGAAKINGRAVDNQTIASFARDLARSKYFQKFYNKVAGPGGNGVLTGISCS